MRLGMPLMRPIDGRKLDGIPDKEERLFDNGQVSNVPVAVRPGKVLKFDSVGLLPYC